MKPLSIDKALKLYTILAPYLPDEIDDGFNFIGTIINSIKNSGNHRDYIEAIALMNDMEFDDVILMNIGEIIIKFTEGLITNKIWALKEFCNKVGLNV
jgi:hypothetical protein